MSSLPVAIAAITYAGTVGMFAATCATLYGGALRAGLGRAKAVRLGAGAAVLFGGWAAASAVAAERGWYQGKLGQQLPWLPIAVVGFLGILLVASRTWSAAGALASAGTPGRLAFPHAFRVAGLAFLLAMAAGKLPALFALPAGLGDIATGLAAPYVVARMARGDGRRAGLWFNGFGIVDLVVALSLGGLIQFGAVHTTPSAAALGQLPLAMIPTVGVPLLLALHITSISQLRRPHASASAVESASASRGRIAVPDAL